MLGNLKSRIAGNVCSFATDVMYSTFAPSFCAVPGVQSLQRMRHFV